MPYTNPVVSGTVLVRSAIQSIDYVAGVSGWAIFRDGTAEFNNVTVRGTVIAGGGAVTLDATGLHVLTGTRSTDIDTVHGIVIHSIPDDGSAAQLVPTGLLLSEINPSPLGLAVDTCFIFVGYQNIGLANETPFLSLQAPKYTGKSGPSIVMYGQAANDANPDNSSEIDLNATQQVLLTTQLTRVAHRLISDNTGMDYAASQIFDVTINVLAADTTRSTGLVNWPVAFPPGSTIFAFANYKVSSLGLGALPFWSARMKQYGPSQYECYAYSPGGVAAGANQALTVSVVAFIIPA